MERKHDSTELATHLKKPSDSWKRAFDARRQRKIERNAARRAHKREIARRVRHAVRGPHVPFRIPAILDYYADRIGLTNPSRSGTQKVVLPEVLSFIDNPEETLTALDAMVAGSGWGTEELFLDHSKCKQLDHGAVSVVAALATQVQRRRILVNGRNPEDPIANEIIWAVGAPRVLRYISGGIPDNFLSFPLTKCGPSSGGSKASGSAIRTSWRDVPICMIARI